MDNLQYIRNFFTEYITAITADSSSSTKEILDEFAARFKAAIEAEAYEKFYDALPLGEPENYDTNLVNLLKEDNV